MSTITTKNGDKIFYKDWGEGQPIVFSHGWPLSSDAWNGQMLFFLEKGFRVIAHDRRGHGRSSQTWKNNNMDQYSDDLAELIEQLDLSDVILVGHSTGGGEVTRYVGRHGTDRVAMVVLAGAVPPLLLKTEKSPDGIAKEAFDDMRKNLQNNYLPFLEDFTLPFYGFNRKNVKVLEALRESFMHQTMMGGIKSIFDSVEQFSESDFFDDLKKFDVPTLIAHGDDDQIVPIKPSAMVTSKLIKDCELKIYPGACHAFPETNTEEFNQDMLRFIQSHQETGKAKAYPRARPEGQDISAH